MPRGRQPSLEQFVEERLIGLEAALAERARADIEAIRELRALRREWHTARPGTLEVAS